jgi:hypothetical protein
MLPGKKNLPVYSLYTPFMPSELFGSFMMLAGSHGGVMDEEGTSHPLEPVLHLNGRPPPPPPPPTPDTMPQKQTGIDLNPPLAEAIFKGIEDAAVEELRTFPPFLLLFTLLFIKKISNTDPILQTNFQEVMFSTLLFYSIHFQYYLLSPL